MGEKLNVRDINCETEVSKENTTTLQTKRKWWQLEENRNIKHSYHGHARRGVDHLHLQEGRQCTIHMHFYTYNEVV